jgi:hypothetical protein
MSGILDSSEYLLFTAISGKQSRVLLLEENVPSAGENFH